LNGFERCQNNGNNQNKTHDLALNQAPLEMDKHFEGELMLSNLSVLDQKRKLV
jgi:hypothetical protein